LLSSPPEDDQLGVDTGAGLDQLVSATTGAGSGAVAGFGARFFTAFLGAAFFGAAFLADDFFADFFAAFLADFFTAFFADFFADFFAAFLPDFFADFLDALVLFFAISFLAFLAFDFFFFALAIVVLLLTPATRSTGAQALPTRGPFIDLINKSGRGPPVAQSSSSIVCTTGTDVPSALSTEPICTMQPMLPAEITSGFVDAMLAIFRSRSRLAMSGWRMLYVPAEPQHRGLSGTSFSTNPLLDWNSFGR
jgi:hypothetical protein